jgi:holliday junction DNA helicase RuvA
MISILQGVVLEATPLSVVIDVGGVGYEVRVPVSTAERVPGVGKPVKLFIHDVYREDDQSLYGFISREERDFFRLLIEKVSGIGPKIALALLSKLSIQMISSAIAAGDVAMLSKTPGIGKKTAERLVVELRDKVLPSGLSKGLAVTGASSVQGSAEANSFIDAVNALVALGYGVDVADKAVRKAVSKLGSEAPTEALLKAALSA